MWHLYCSFVQPSPRQSADRHHLAYVDPSRTQPILKLHWPRDGRFSLCLPETPPQLTHKLLAMGHCKAASPTLYLPRAVHSCSGNSPQLALLAHSPYIMGKTFDGVTLVLD